MNGIIRGIITLVNHSGILRITMGSARLFCDSCHWKSQGKVSIRDIPGMLGMTCPRCGAIVITDHDVETARWLMNNLMMDAGPKGNDGITVNSREL